MNGKSLIAKIVAGSAFGDFVYRSIYYHKKQQLIRSFQAPIFNNREELYDFIISNELKNEPINYLEFGVYLGESIKYWIDKYKNPLSNFYGFDTFTGIPEDWAANRPKGSYSANGKAPDIKDNRVEFIVGLFSDTLHEFIEKRFDNSKRNVIHLDADLYSSTMYVLNAIIIKLKKGDVLIFDEWGGPLLHEFKAFADFFSYSDLKYVFAGATKGFQGVAVKIV